MEIARSAADVAAKAPTLLTSLPKPQALMAVAREIAAAKLKRVVIVEMSTFAISDKEKAERMLAKAGHVEVVSVAPAGAKLAQEAADYLALHGIHAELAMVDPAGRPPAEALLTAAAEGGVSLLVAGGYGHSRLFETLFGGATVHIAAHATLPLFMVH